MNLIEIVFTTNTATLYFLNNTADIISIWNTTGTKNLEYKRKNKIYKQYKVDIIKTICTLNLKPPFQFERWSDPYVETLNFHN